MEGSGKSGDPDTTTVKPKGHALGPAFRWDLTRASLLP